MKPHWFTQLLDRKPTDHTCIVDGAEIHYLHWQNPDKPGLLLVHGHAAHAHWWDFIAPALIENYNIVAIDLSGSGDSAHREVYSATTYAKEILACVQDAKLKETTLVGHSFGGSMVRVAAFQNPDSYRGLIIIDSVIPTKRGARTPPPMPRNRTRFYPTIEEGQRRFRLRPPQPCGNDYVIEHIARHSLKQTDKGFQFKLDSAVFAKMPDNEQLPTAAEMIDKLTIPVGFIYGEQSRFFPKEFVEALTQQINPDWLYRIPNAYHHVFLDQPQQFTIVLKELLTKMSQR